jgi:hypothetical protein
VRVPLAVGLKTTLVEQLAEAARLVPHVLLLIAKSPALVPPMVTLLMVMEEAVPFVNVADCAALVDPTAVLGNPSDVGDTVTLPPDVLPPVPDNATVCGLLLDESETVSVAARDPLVLGLNAMETLQLAAAARLLPQVLLEITKSPGFVPVTDTLLMVIEELDPFLSVAVCDALVEPTFTEPNEREVGLIVTVPPVPVPVPDRDTVCGVFVAESLKLSVAVRVPLTVGANATLAVQLADAARLVPHVLLVIR